MKNIILLIVVSLLFLMVSCQNEGSLLRALSNSTKEEDLSLDNDLNIQNMVDDTTYHYLAAYGYYYKRKIVDVGKTWEEITTVPSGSKCLALQYFTPSNRLYLGYINDQTNEYGLYDSSDQAASWNSVSFYAGKQIIDLWSVNSDTVLLVSYYDPSRSSNKFGLDYSTDGTSFSATTLSSLDTPVTSAIFQGGDYYVITKDKVYKGSNLTSLAETTHPDSSLTLSKIFHSGSKFYISAAKSKIFSSSDALSWTASSEQLIYGKAVAFTDFIEINSNVLVGTANYGFFQMKDGDVANLERPSSLLNSALYYAYLHKFQKTGNLVYFLTKDKGLFSNSYDGTNWNAEWVRE